MISQLTKISDLQDAAQYKIMPCQCHSEELGDYLSYGIEIQAGSDVVIIEDVNVDKQWVEQLVEKFNRLEVAPIHVMDVIIDSL